MNRIPSANRSFGFSLLRPLHPLVLLASAVLALIVCVLAAQAETRPDQAALAPGGGVVTPRLTGHEFIASDGMPLPMRKWLPRGPVKAVVLSLHGFNDYSHAFELPAQAWAARGIATYAYDQRGFGGSPDRGLWAGEGRLAIDAITALRLLRRAYPGRPVYLLGESMGGAIAILVATGTMTGVIAGPDGLPRAEADGVILVAPAVWGRATMDLLPKAALFLAVRFFPHAALTGRGLGVRISDNDAVLRQMSRDPLIIRETRVDAVYGLVDLMDSALAAAPYLDVPLLLLYGGRDEVVPRRPVAEFVMNLPAEPRRLRRLAYYPAGYHLLLRDLGGSVVADDVASWIADPRSPLPSKSDAAAGTSPWLPSIDRGAAAHEVPGTSPASAAPKAVTAPRG